jgi:membrane carboxypeptidase/penicillin-binding protein
MKKISCLSLALISAVSIYSANADQHQSYALDKLANAQAQLERLKGQRKAVDELIRAVKKDLRAAKIRAKAERLQLEADTVRQDAVVMVEQTGVAVDLPNLMNAKGVDAGIIEYDENSDDINRTMKKTSERSVYFPSGRKVEPENSSDLPDYIK